MYKDKNLIIREIKEKDLEEIWQKSYKDNLEWIKWNGPYFNDPIYSKEKFMEEEGPQYYINKENRYLIEVDSNIVGILTYYFEDGKLMQWVEFGIVVFDDSYWGQGIGQRACKLWMNHIFNKYDHIQRLGFTTWSGNQRMINLGRKLGMSEEARIRRVRFYDNKYWDSIKYGILREEFNRELNTIEPQTNQK